MKTREQALAALRARMQPDIDTAKSDAEELEALVSTRVRVAQNSAGVANARENAQLWQMRWQERLATALAAPSITTPTANAVKQRERQRQLEQALTQREKEINAYYDELERRDQTQVVVVNPPPEVV